MRRGTKVCSVSTSALLSGATPLGKAGDEGDRPGDPFALPAVTLAGLTSKQRREVERKIEDLRPLLMPASDGRSRTERLVARANQLRVSVRTLERRLGRFEARGPAGLADARILKETRRAVDPAWDRACREVLSSFVPEATPNSAGRSPSGPRARWRGCGPHVQASSSSWTRTVWMCSPWNRSRTGESTPS